MCFMPMFTMFCSLIFLSIPLYIPDCSYALTRQGDSIAGFSYPPSSALFKGAITRLRLCSFLEFVFIFLVFLGSGNSRIAPRHGKWLF
ncbi:hypothetical protein BDZ91DRAFT_714434 [Kalaharituber pfeilii]|nr:hypothetical protein BDZ91DRAFT_714434 [Kalaharituber pfeilii]